MIWGIIKAFIKGVLRSRVAIVGTVMATVILPVLTIFTILDMQGIVRNPYFNFLNYVVLGPLFVIGLILVVIGLFIGKGDEDLGVFTYEYLKEQFSMPGRFTRVRRLLFLVTGLTLVTMFVVGLVSYTGLRYTDSTSFCGQFCHTVMEPEYITYRNSPHSQVACVACHFGEGSWSPGTKLSGIRQIFAVALNTYRRPIEAPATHLRPNRESCEQCHLPEKFHGDKLYVKDRYLDDEHNTHVQTVLLMKVGSGGGYRGSQAHGIHWHVGERNKVYYRAVDKQRNVISEVRLKKKDGSEIVYAAGNGKFAGVGEMRVMDCVDCHNRPTHVFLTPSEALDRKMFRGIIPLSLPFIKKVGLEALDKTYLSTEEARIGISRHLRAWYGEHYPDLLEQRTALIERAAAGVFEAYRENVFPEMNVGWSTYQSFLGHRDDGGCFRCHDGKHLAPNGTVITNDCNACHIVLAENEPSPDVVRLLHGQDDDDR